MVSVNSSSNAWNNWQTRNAPPPSEPPPAPVATTPPSGGGDTPPSGGANATTASVTITTPPDTPLVYSPAAATQFGRSAVPAAASLGDRLDSQGFFSASASADQSQQDVTGQASASPALPQALTQAEVIARAAYTLVSEAGADNPAASIVEQFG